MLIWHVIDAHVSVVMEIAPALRADRLETAVTASITYPTEDV